MAKTLWDYLTDAGEVMATLGTGAVAGVAGPAYGIYKGVTSPKYGTYEGGVEADKAAMDMMAQLTYQPRGEFAQGLLGKVGGAMDTMKIPALLPELAPLAALSLNDKAILSQAQRGVQAAKPIVGDALEGYMAQSGLAPRIVPESTAKPPPPPMAPVSPAGFYSAAEQAALNLPRNKGTGQALLNDLLKGADVKKEELQATGVLDAFANRPQATKQELIDFLQENRLDVEETRLAAVQTPKVEITNHSSYSDGDIRTPNADKAIDEWDLSYTIPGDDESTSYTAYRLGGDGLEPERVELYDGRGNLVNEYDSVYDAEEYVQGDAQWSASQAKSNPKFDELRYTLPGGENYREVMLELPRRPLPEELNVVNWAKANGFDVQDVGRKGSFANERWIQAIQDAKQEFGDRNFTESHWDDPNAFAHLRLNDRVDVDGKKMTLIEEVQSDWHQKGRARGYNREENKSLQNKAKGEYTALASQAYELIANSHPELVGRPAGELINLAREGAYAERHNLIDPSFRTALAPLIKKVDAANRKIKETREGPVPDAPMKDTWYQTAIRKAVKDAIDSGSDRVAITTGDRQVERFGSGSNEKGLKQYYDETYPKYLQKFAKKYGAKVTDGSVPLPVEDTWPAFRDWAEERGIFGSAINEWKRGSSSKLVQEYLKSAQTLEPVRYIEITPEMRKALGGKDKGVPLFQAAPLIPAGAAGSGGLLDQFGERQE
jgi:hypothetical protein